MIKSKFNSNLFIKNNRTNIIEKKYDTCNIYDCKIIIQNDEGTREKFKLKFKYNFTALFKCNYSF